MAEYIKKSIAIAIVSDSADMYPFEKNEAIRRIEDSTPAEVAPVRHGRWVEDERTYPGPGLANNLCSVCGEIAGAWKEGLAPERKWAYCPACGALMDGKEDEHEAD